MDDKRFNRDQFNRLKYKLRQLEKDILEEAIASLDIAVNEGVNIAKENTPVDTGFMRRSWSVSTTKRLKGGCQKIIMNSAEYSLYVDQGHRVVDRNGKVHGWKKGEYISDKTIKYVNTRLLAEFKARLERLEKRYNDID